MLNIHHLYDSRSERLLYCASLYAIPHQVTAYQRDAQTQLAPAAFKKVHTLGTAPVLQDGNFMIAESGAALTYMVQEYAGDKGLPPARSKAYYRCVELVHFVEGSLFANLSAYALLKMSGADMQAGFNDMLGQRLQKNLEFLTQTLGAQRYICGDELTIADLMLAFTFDIAQGAVFQGAFELTGWQQHTALNQYADRLRDNEHYIYSKRRDF